MTKTPKLVASLLAILLLSTACGGSGSSSGDTSTAPTAATAPTAPTTTTAAPVESDDSADGDSEDGNAVAEAASLTITEVSFSKSTVTIRNDGSEPVDLTGYFMCNRPSYSEIPETTIDAGASLEIDASGIGIDGSNGEFAVYQSSSYSSADDIVAYVQWGGAGNGRASVAVDAGLIGEGEFVDNGGEDFTVG